MTQKQIPLFPLELVLFPGDKLPLHIFEQRYRDMVNDCLLYKQPFGIVSYIDSKISRIGCYARIAHVENAYDDGKFDIVCRGGDRFITNTYDNSKSYLQARVTDFHDDEQMQMTEEEKRLFDHVSQRFNVLVSLASMQFEDPGFEPPNYSFEFGHIVGFDLAQKQNLLEIKTEKERLEFIRDHIEASIPRLEAFEDVRKLIRSNGHFREFPPIDFNI